MSRRIAAMIEIDEDSIGDKAPGEYLEENVSFLRESGISLENWYIADADDELAWGRYITYLLDWVLSHTFEDCEGASPASYDVWRKSIDYLRVLPDVVGV